MRLRPVKLVVATVAVLLFGVAWQLLWIPPPRLLLRYGLLSWMGPTGETLTVEGVEFVEISPGYFRMGSDHLAEGGDLLGRVCSVFGLPWGEQPEPSDEMPVHWVELPRVWWIARTEVTNSQYEAFDPEHERGEYGPDDDDPVMEVSWDDAKRYCAWLSEKVSHPVRLPTEAEWECACRSGSDQEFCFGDDEAGLGRAAWYRENSEGRAHTVATREPSRWGLYDLHGNVWEWCEDTYHESYAGAPGDGTAWTEGGVEWEGSPRRVFRGGSWRNPAVDCRSAFRDRWRPSDRRDFLGFRPAFSLTAAERRRVVRRSAEE